MPNDSESPRSAKDIPLEYLLSVFEGGEPMITSEIEERFEIRHRTAVDKLEQLHERGQLERKKIGTQLAVWWKPRRDDLEEETACIEIEVIPDESGASTPTSRPGADEVV